MDRSAHLRRVLPSLLEQDYPSYSVYVVDNSSTDGAASVFEELRSPRLEVLCRPRPRYFSLAASRNCGIRYSFSDLCLFMDADMSFAGREHLSRLVSQFRHDDRVDHDWFARWRRDCGYGDVTPGRPPPQLGPARRVYCHCLGSPLLVDRRAIQAIGGYDESLTDWGYEDTDLCGRLELCGFGRIEMEPVVHLTHEAWLRVVNYALKDPPSSWQRNRLRSDRTIAAFGCVSPAPRFPGRSAWIEIDGRRWDGAVAPQQHWEMPDERNGEGRAAAARATP